MITPYDYFILGFYLVFMLSLGLVFRKLSKSTSDYFRCGGAMPWWLTGVSAWIAGFSAWTFTGAAGKIYETGTLVLLLYYAAVPAVVVVLFLTCQRFRRMRVVTYMEAVRQRYGVATEQLYTWIKLPMLLIFAGVSLNAIGVFMAAVFGVDVNKTLVILGVAVTLVAVVGGAWAVLASDFVQMFLIVTITLVGTFLALRLPGVGGVTGLIHQLPSSHFHWSELARPQVIVIWTAALLWVKLMEANNFESSSMYLMVKNDRDARRMVLIPLLGTLIGPAIWIVPPLVARITHPDLAAEFPQLKQPHEAAFVAVAHDTMPQGLLGLLICAMFGATLTSMDASLNKGAGVFIKNFYQPILKPKASEKHLLITSKLCTLTFGAIIIFNAIQVNQLREIGLFDLTNLLAANLATPLLVPLFLGLFVKRTPGWSGWSTVLVGFATSMGLYAWFKHDPQGLGRLLGWQGEMSKRELTDAQFFAPIFVDSAVCFAWYFFTSLFYEKSSAAQKASAEKLFANMATPIDEKAEGVENLDAVLYKMIGSLCLVYGTFILCLMLIPNDNRRFAFLFCGGIMAGSGAIMMAIARRKTAAQRRVAALAAEPPPRVPALATGQ